jgi:hypothetical protein
VNAKIQAPAQKNMNLNDQHSQIPDDKTQGYKVYGANEFAVPRAATKNYINNILYIYTYIYL